MNYSIVAAEQHRSKLSLTASFTEMELKSAYRKLMSQWHPDRYTPGTQIHIEATEKASLINVAYEFLSEVLECNGGIYHAPVETNHQAWSASDMEPKRTYEGKAYTVGFPDEFVTEIFLKSSHIVSTGYRSKTETLYIKFSGNIVYKYISVPSQIFEEFLAAESHGKYANKNIYLKYRQERF